MPIWKIRHELWNETGLKKYKGIQPWSLKVKNIKPSKAFEFRIRTRFKSEVKDKKVFLVIEDADKWELTVNGKPVSTNVKEWHWDKQFGKIDISENLKIGENYLEVSCYNDLDTHVEDMYLVGEFGVKKISDTEFVITNEPEELRNGSWTEQGYPFYCGTMRYECAIESGRLLPHERIILRLPKAKGTLFLISVNGQEFMPVCWSPLEIDITKYVHKGKNRLTVDVVSSLRNTFGPLHNKNCDLEFVSPSSFIDEQNWTEKYQFVPYGLLKGAEFVVVKEKKGYID